MYKKLIALQNQWLADKKQLEIEIEKLEFVTNESEKPVFNELTAANRITTAQSKDRLEGTDTAESIIEEIKNERDKFNEEYERFIKEKSSAVLKLPQKKAQLVCIDREINVTQHKIKLIMDDEAKSILQTKISEYHQSAGHLLNLLVEIDALNAIFSESPESSPVKYVQSLESLPALNIDNSEDIQLWGIDSTNRKLIFTRENAFSAVRSKIQSITEEIKGYLNEK